MDTIRKYLILIFLSVCLAGCGSIPDGEYTASVSLTGGSGRATIESPCMVTVENGRALARLKWSSPYYDYMIVDGQTYYPVNEEGNSEFVVPVKPEEEMNIQADTTAMSTPHLIDYTLFISFEDKDGKAEGGRETERTEAVTDREAALQPPEIEGLSYVSTDENIYAECFRIHRYEDGYTVIGVEDGRKYLLIPEGAGVPSGCGEDIIPLKKPVDRIYLAASGAMCHFDSLEAVDRVLLSGIEKDAWYIDAAKEAMESKELIYGGKYSAPDYEQIVMKEITLAIESTMILHVPKVQEKLEQTGVPVFIDRSSYETQPLGRCEWIKVYGVLLGKEEKACDAFAKQKEQVEAIAFDTEDEKSVVFFSLNSNHQIVTRRGNDYFAKLIKMAGGNYLAPDNSEEDTASQMTISVEAFYDYAADADILIYNTTIESAPESLEELKGTDVTFRDFQAFQTGNVWYTDKSLYQYADETGTIIHDLFRVIEEGKEETEFFHKLK